MPANDRTFLKSGWQGTHITSMNLRYAPLRECEHTWVVDGLVPVNLFDGEVNAVENSFLRQQLEYLLQRSALSNLPLHNNVFSIEQLKDKAIVGFLVISEFTSCFCASCLILPRERELGYFCEVMIRITRFVFTDFKTKKIAINLIKKDNDEEECLKTIGFKFDSKFRPSAKYKDSLNKAFFVLEQKNWDLSKHPILFVVAAALIDHKGRVLIAKRPEKKPMAGLWEFPGGKVQKTEVPEVAIIRELHEELGIDVSESCLAPFSFVSHIYENFHLIMPLYLCRVWRGSLRKVTHSKLKWVDPMRLRDYPMPPANSPLIGMLQDFL